MKKKQSKPSNPDNEKTYPWLPYAWYALWVVVAIIGAYIKNTDMSCMGIMAVILTRIMKYLE